jgi:hypothetical protein
LELLLNLLWLLLVVPAAWIWQQARYAQPACPAGSKRSLVLVACVVLLLFPTISASDDLVAMRPEVEEATSQDAFRHSEGCHANTPDKADVPALQPEPAILVPQWACMGQVVALVVQHRSAPSPIAPRGRAPPASILG